MDAIEIGQVIACVRCKHGVLMPPGTTREQAELELLEGLATDSDPPDGCVWMVITLKEWSDQ